MKITLTANFRQLIFVLLALLVSTSAGAEKPLRIGYYGGTFDPPTLGHLSLAERARKAANLDLVFVMPSMTNSKKPNMTSYEHRREMVRLNFSSSIYLHADVETEKAFQADRATGVMRILMQRYPGSQIMRITGDDVISRNFTPEMQNNPEFKKVGLIIGERAGDNKSLAENMAHFDLSNREVVIIPGETDLGISSSLVRKIIREKAGAPPLLKTILNYIEKENLYRDASDCKELFQTEENKVLEKRTGS